MTNAADITTLIDELHRASEIYYQELGESPLTDEEFDAKHAYLRELQEAGAFPELFAEGTRGFLVLEGDPSLGTKSTADDIVKHRVPMLSLGKAKKEEELRSFLTKTRAAGAKDFRLQAKLDGFALAAEYHDGHLTCLSTRGDGVEGENISYLLNHAEVSIVGMPTELTLDSDLEVRGELFLTADQFARLDAARTAAGATDAYKLSRNALVGIIKKAKLGIGYPAEVTFAAYSVLEDGEPADLDILADEEFKSVDVVTEEIATGVKLTGFADDDEVVTAVQAFGKARENFPLPTDGVVIKPTNEAEMQGKMGSSSHHPRSQVAFKFPSPTAITELLAIDLSVGKTGKVTPIGRIKTVQLDGSDISNLSLHNFNLLYTEDIRVGQTVMIHKANDIIPQVKAVISTPEGAELMPVPDNCPVCEEPLSAAREEEGVWPPKTLLCKNRGCPSRDFFALKTAVGKDYLDIDGMSEKLLTHLNDIGRVSTIADLYTLTLEELANASFGTTKEGNPVRLGEKRAQHIIDHIEKSKSRPMPKIVAGLAIPGLGRTMTKLLMKRFKNIDELLAAKVEEIEVLDKLGTIRAQAIVDGLAHRATMIATLREHGVEFAVDEVAEDAHLAGKSFAISGAVPAPFANRGAWVDYIEANGGAFHSGPKAETTYMVGDPEDSSSKVKKAVKLGVEFISPEDFTAQFVK